MSARRSVVAWCLYDFANSSYAAVIIATVWAAHYANVIVGNDAGQGDLWWGRAVSGSMLLVALTSPVAGALADLTGSRKRLLLLYTLLAIGGTALLATVTPGLVVYGFLITLLANFGFEGAMVFYNSYLPELAPRESQGRLSGWGFGAGYAGSVLGLLAVLPLVENQRYDAAYAVVAALFLLFSLPAFLWLPRSPARSLSLSGAARRGLAETRSTLKKIWHTKDLRRFLLAYFLYIDGVNTVIFFSSIFAAHTLGFTMTELILVYLVVQVSALIGAFVWAVPTDRSGPRRVVLLMVGQWSVVVVAAYFVATKGAFLVLAALAGTGLGAIQSASRVFFARLIPAGSEGEYFGFYALSGKTASILGPLVFGATSALSGGNQRLAVLSVLIFFVAGGALLWGVRAGGPASVSDRLSGSAR